MTTKCYDIDYLSGEIIIDTSESDIDLKDYKKIIEKWKGKEITDPYHINRISEYSVNIKEVYNIELDENYNIVVSVNPPEVDYLSYGLPCYNKEKILEDIIDIFNIFKEVLGERFDSLKIISDFTFVEITGNEYKYKIEINAKEGKISLCKKKEIEDYKQYLTEIKQMLSEYTSQSIEKDINEYLKNNYYPIKVININ